MKKPIFISLLIASTILLLAGGTVLGLYYGTDLFSSGGGAVYIYITPVPTHPYVPALIHTSQQTPTQTYHQYATATATPTAQHATATPTAQHATATPTAAAHTTATPTSVTLLRDPWDHPEVMKLYITPNDSAVKSALSGILNSPWRGFSSDFNDLRDWVRWHVSYVSDQEAHGVKEYWQLPSETISLGTGDCEDFAILLCSLLRAYGVPADEVYVGAGFYDDPNVSGHAFLFDHWYESIWRAVEPQLFSWTDWFWGDLDTSEYDKFYSFNDQECFSGKPTPPAGVYEVEVGYSFWPATSGASVQFERYLSSGQNVIGAVSWQGTSSVSYNWSLYVYYPNGSCLTSWSGKSLSHSFFVTASKTGTYTIKILKRDYMPRVARMEVSPPGWTQE